MAEELSNNLPIKKRGRVKSVASFHVQGKKTGSKKKRKQWITLIDGTLRCKLCNEPPFSTRYKWRKHAKITHKIIFKSNPRKYHCASCNLQFGSKSECFLHKVDSHKGDMFCCDLCGDLLSSKNSLIDHFKRHEKEKFRREKISRKVLSLLYPPQSSENSSERRFSCKVCDKTYSNLSNLKNHISRIHLGKPELFECKICRKSYSTNSSLKTHMLRHSGAKPFQCKLCPAAFPDNSTLHRHIRRHQDTRLHICHICSKSFVENRALEAHLRVHTGEKPFGCQYCEKTFTQEYSARVHERLHTGERPYVCAVVYCQKGFAQRNSLQIHILTHEKELTPSDYAELCATVPPMRKRVQVFPELKNQPAVKFMAKDPPYITSLNLMEENDGLSAEDSADEDANDMVTFRSSPQNPPTKIPEALEQVGGEEGEIMYPEVVIDEGTSPVEEERQYQDEMFQDESLLNSSKFPLSTVVDKTSDDEMGKQPAQIMADQDGGTQNKKRGRPRKNSPKTANNEAAGVETEVQPEPPQIISDQDGGTEKKKRGRPRKNSSKTSNKTGLKKKKKNNKKRKKECSFCEKEFNSNSGLRYHTLSQHVQNNPYECNFCGKAIPTKSLLRQHIKKHGTELGWNAVDCQICGKAFKINSLLSRHMISHSEERQHSCAECGKSFKMRASLNMHMRKHLSFTPYECSLCPKAFTRRYGLDAHMRTHTKERPERRDVCQNTFSDKPALLRHVRKVHTGVKYDCSQDSCGRSFSVFNTYKRHVASHLTVSCDICGAKLRNNEQLRSHVLSRHS